MRMIPGLLALITAASLAQAPSATTSLETCSAEDYAVYAAALGHLFGKRTEKIVLINQTSAGFPPGMAAWTRFPGNAQPLLKRVPKEARDDFDARKKTPAKIEADKIRTSLAIILLSPDEAEKMVRGAGWADFLNSYKSRGITLVSRPGFDSDHTHALLYAGTSCGLTCGGGSLIFLTKENGEWKVSDTANIWTS